MKGVNRVREHGEAIDAANPILHTLDAQHVANTSTGLDQAEGEVALGELRMEGKEHARPGHVDHRGRGEITDHETDGFSRLVDPGDDGVEDMLGIEVNDAGFNTEREHARRRFVVGMAQEVGVAAGSRDLPEEGDVRRRRAPP